MKIQPVRGTHDLFGEELDKTKLIENIIRKIARNFDFNEIVTPIFESSELFIKPLGEHSDVVLKEMYTFNDRNNSSLTLRPEYTTPIIRASISNNLLEKLPTKLFAIGSMFRRERPQKGRFRQFNQMNFEILGSDDALADSELILIAKKILEDLLLDNKFKLYINSLGDRDTLKAYKKELSNFFNKYKKDLSEDSQSKIDTNPLRILDSKENTDIKICKDAPLISKLYSYEASKQFDEVKNLLTSSGIEFLQDNFLVRGLDYYCKTVFEFKNSNLGSQDTLIGGGRYNGLVKAIGGPDIPGVGWAGGIERIALLKESKKNENLNFHLILIDEKVKNYGIETLKKLNNKGFPVYFDYKYNLKKSLAYANKKEAKFAIIIGEDELKGKFYTLKDLTNSKQQKFNFNDLIIKLSK